MDGATPGGGAGSAAGAWVGAFVGSGGGVGVGSGPGAGVGSGVGVGSAIGADELPVPGEGSAANARPGGATSANPAPSRPASANCRRAVGGSVGRRRRAWQPGDKREGRGLSRVRCARSAAGAGFGRAWARADLCAVPSSRSGDQAERSKPATTSVAVPASCRIRVFITLVCACIDQPARSAWTLPRRQRSTNTRTGRTGSC